MRAARGARAVAPVAHFVLPVSGLAVTLHQPTGVEDLLLAERQVEDPGLVLALVERLAGTAEATDWASLPVTDIDTLIVRLRQVLVGNRVVAEVPCGTSACGQLVDLSFTLESYLAHHRPRHGGVLGRRTRPCESTPGWYELQTGSGASARFRLPTLRDQIVVYRQPEAVAALAGRCIETVDGTERRAQGRVEAAMTALAPPLAGPLRGRCPHCAGSIEAWFEARLYCLQELRDRARFIHDDVDTLAERYHWSERAILTLPQVRRAQYVERARQARVGWSA